MSVNGLLAPFVAFLAGLLSFVSPCVLPLVPVYIAQMAGNSSSLADQPNARRTSFLHACSFVGGFSILFIVLGASIGLAGYGLRDHQRLLAEAAGVAIVIMGLHLTGILRIPALYRTYAVSVPGTSGRERDAGPVSLPYGRSALIGAGFALGWTPCIGPVLGSILTLAAVESTVIKGIVLLVCYSLGLGLPFLITGMAVGSITSGLKRINRFLPAIERGSGMLLILVGVLLIADRLTIFNHYFDLFGVGTRGL